MTTNKKRRIGRKVFAILLTLCLVFSTTCTSVFATELTETPVAGDAVAQTESNSQPEAAEGTGSTPNTVPEATQPSNGETVSTLTAVNAGTDPSSKADVPKAAQAKASVKASGLNAGHKVNVRFVVLYLDSTLFTGYTFGNSESTTFTCQYSVDHSATAYNNHTIAISDIQAAAGRLTITDGYKVEGWTKSASKNPTINPFTGSPTACNKGDTIYIVAKKASKTFTLKYDVKGGSGVPATQTQESTATSYDFTISPTQPTKTGYTFLGWSTSSTATSPSYYGGGTIKVTGTTTLYAVWQKNAEKVTLTYKDRNGIYNGPTEYDKNATVQVLNCTNTRGSYDFIGWDTDESAEEVVYEAGDTFKIGKTMTLYAVWKLKDTDNGKGISITKTRTSINGNEDQTIAERGDEIEWEIKVTNNSNVTKTVTLKETLQGAYFVLNNQNTITVTVAADKSQTVYAKYTVKGTDKGTLENTVTASTGGTGTLENPSATDSGTKIDDGKGISITKTRASINGDSSKTSAKPDDVIKWNITVKNNSSVEKKVTLTEGLDGATLSKNSVTLAAGGSETVTATYKVKDSDKGKTLTNTVIASTGGTGTLENPSATDSGTKIDPDNGNGISVTKTRTSAGTAKVGETITWDITVTNLSNVDKTVTLDDQLAEAAGTATLSENPVTLAAGETKTVKATYEVQEADAGKTITNAVTASTGVPGEDKTADDGDGTKIDPDNGNGISVTKTRTSAGTAKVGETITWDITVTNLSNVDKTVTLDDQLAEAAGTATLSENPVTLAAGETKTVKATYEVQEADAGKTITNAVTASTGVPGEDKTADDGDGTKISPADPDEDTITITFNYVYEDEDGTEVELQESVEVPVTKDGAYDVSGYVPFTIEKDGQKYEMDSVDGDLTGTAEKDMTITVKYVPATVDPVDPVDPVNPVDPTPPTPVNPTPPTPVGPTPITPVGPAATPTAATPALAAAPAAAPAAALVPVADAAVPLANVDADDTRQVNDEDVPLAKGAENEWALLNLLLMIFTILVSVMLLIFYFIGRKEDKDDEYNERLQAASEDETEAKLKRKGLFRLLSIIPAVVAVIFFILTEDMRNPMVFTDKWTLWMAVFALVNVVLAVFAKKKHYDNDDTQKPDYGIA